MAKLTQQQIEGLKRTQSPVMKRRFLFLFSHPQIKEVLFSDLTEQNIQQIVDQYSLSTKQHQKLTQIIIRVLTAEASINKLPEYISQELNTPPQETQNIAKQINEKILAPVKEELDQAYREAMTPDFVKKPESETSAKNQPLETNQQIQTAPVIPAIPATPAVSAPNLAPEPEAVQPQSPPLAPAPPANLPITDNSQIPPIINPASIPPDQDRDRSATVPTESNQSPSSVSNLQDIRALAKQNPQVLDQQITASLLQESGTGNSIAPTVRNWLLDYTKVAGAGQHSSLDRGRYLFKSPNAKNLSESERKFLSQILESYDEALPVKIDPEAKLLVIPKYDPSPSVQRSDDVRTFKIQPVSFNNIVDLQDL